MIDPAVALAAIPSQLRDPLIAEFGVINQNYFEHRWSPSELGGGKFCEIVYTILDGYAKSSFASAPSKPKDFPSACRALESHAHVPRSFQILIPRSLPALYEIRNNRGVGHAGGDVNSNNMDATYVVSSCTWIMCELVRCFHQTTIEEAQRLVDALAERKMPLVWVGPQTKRVLDTTLKLSDQILLLAGTSAAAVPLETMMRWCDYSNKQYFTKSIISLHKKRLIEFTSADQTVLLLPPGADRVATLVKAKR